MENNNEQYYPSPVTLMQLLKDSYLFTEADDEKIISVILEDGSIDTMKVSDYRKASKMLFTAFGSQFSEFLSEHGITLNK